MKNFILSLALIVLTAVADGQNVTGNVIRKEIRIKKGQTYLNFPVNNSDKLVRATVTVKGKPVERFTINLATADPSFYTFFDVSAYQGQKITVELENAPQGFQAPGQQNASGTSENNQLDPKVLDLIFADSYFPGQDSLYREKDRPQVHFTASRGWMNDPNGLIYYNGEYHLFFQHNPYGWQWGNMHWGHAVSKDLIHWQQLNEALYPYLEDLTSARGDSPFSGSAVIDPLNTAGFRRDGIDPMIAVYTSTGRGECLKISYDNGRTFEEYSGNPVLKHNGRDPKVFWYEPGGHWVMVVWESGMPKKLSNGEEVSLREHSIYTSSDLKNWKYQSGISGFFECPELFELPVEGEPGNRKWIMYDAHGRYIVGDFDGKVFKTEQHFTKYEHGGGYFYASQTFNNTPDGRRIQIGWGRNITQPGMPFNQPQLMPCELKLRRTFSGYRLCPVPVREIDVLKKDTKSLNDKLVSSGESVKMPVNADKPLHILLEIERGDAPVTLNILGFEIKFDNEWIFEATYPDAGEKASERPAGPFPPPTVEPPVIYVPGSDIFKVEAIVDKNILEFFVNDGELYHVSAFNSKKEPSVSAGITGSSNMRGGSRKFLVRSIQVSELSSIWQ